MNKKNILNIMDNKLMPKGQLQKELSPTCDEVVILDFETTGLSSDYDRTIEVGALLVRNHTIIDEFVELMNPGFAVPSFITSFTGISNAMLKGKPKPEIIMPKLLDFIGKRPIVAHNASFDKRFLMAELARANLSTELGMQTPSLKHAITMMTRKIKLLT
jgi:DNA polymerase III epsilon subunit-like protein